MTLKMSRNQLILMRRITLRLQQPLLHQVFAMFVWLIIIIIIIIIIIRFYGLSKQSVFIAQLVAVHEFVQSVLEELQWWSINYLLWQQIPAIYNSLAASRDNVVIVSCGHASFCANCVQVLASRQGHCLIRRPAISTTLKFFNWVYQSINQTRQFLTRRNTAKPLQGRNRTRPPRPTLWESR